MKAVEWGPMLFAGATGIVTLVLYLMGKGPRWTGFFVAAFVLFAVAGFGPLLSVAHHPVTSGAMVTVIVIGAIGSVVLFWFIVCKGHHEHALIKRKAAGGPQGGGGSQKAPHHRAMAVTVGMMVFVFLLFFNWHSVWSTGHSGVTQTYSRITK